MPPQIPPQLGSILADVQATLPALRARQGELERAAQETPPGPSFWDALRRGDWIALIGEVKRRSPSAGTIRADLDPVVHARRYASAGARAISVLTEGKHFGGSITDLVGVRNQVSIPVLRKDFIVDEIQLLEARAAGASAALLIVRILPPARLGALLAFGRKLQLDLLVETHTREEIEAALGSGAEIVGVNSRDLDTFALDPARAWELFRLLPRECLAVAESAMHTLADVERAADAGADAVLIGTALSAAEDPAPLIRQVGGVGRHGR